MLKNGFSSNDRPVCQVIQDVELAYVMQRYREIHDTIHVLLGYGVTVPEELAVKWFEMSTLGLPLGALSSISSPLILLNRSLKAQNTEPMTLYFTKYLPHVNKCILNQKALQSSDSFLMNVYFEREFETDIGELRGRTGIVEYGE